VTTERQRRANAANARKSTGPKTARGRVASSGNARKHGLTAAPPWDDVTRYYRIITGDAAALPDPMSRDARAQAALALAEAEAQYARCVTAERRHLVRMAERADNGVHLSLQDAAQKMSLGQPDIDVWEKMLEWEGEAWMRRALKILIRLDPDRPAEIHRRFRSLRRYRREAEARRRKALRRWLEVMGAQGIVESADLAAV
jgi:hypothetical protein